jgi:uncharacterized phage protein (TIGR02220 family)
MARIRTLKPEHKFHRKVGPLSDRAYRLWIGLLTEADDAGRLSGDLPQLLGLIFPYQRALKPLDLQKALDELTTAGLLRAYTVQGTPHLAFPSWTDHQRINRPYPSSIPPPIDDSLNVHGTLREDSVSDHGTLPPEWNGMEGKGRERSIVGLPPDDVSGTPVHESRNGLKADAEEILAFLNTEAGKHFRPGPQTSGLIEARLRAGATVPECRAVIIRRAREWKDDPAWAKYLRPATLFNATKFAQYLGEVPQRPPEAPHA